MTAFQNQDSLCIFQQPFHQMLRNITLMSATYSTAEPVLNHGGNYFFPCTKHSTLILSGNSEFKTFLKDIRNLLTAVKYQPRPSAKAAHVLYFLLNIQTYISVCVYTHTHVCRHVCGYIHPYMHMSRRYLCLRRTIWNFEYELNTTYKFWRALVTLFHHQSEQLHTILYCMISGTTYRFSLLGQVYIANFPMHNWWACILLFSSPSI